MKRLKNSLINPVCQFINKNKIYLSTMMIIFGMLFIIGLLTYFNHKKSTNDFKIFQKKQSEVILKELNNIKLQVQTHTNYRGITATQNQSKSIEQRLDVIQQAVSEMVKLSDVKHMSEQLAKVNKKMDEQLGDLKKKVSTITSNKHYLENTTLPFNVISIDVIAGEVYASISHNNHVLTLVQGDILAGWRIIEIDYDSGILELVNDKEQYVKVNLKG